MTAGDPPLSPEAEVQLLRQEVERLRLQKEKADLEAERARLLAPGPATAGTSAAPTNPSPMDFAAAVGAAVRDTLRGKRARPHGYLSSDEEVEQVVSDDAAQHGQDDLVMATMRACGKVLEVESEPEDDGTADGKHALPACIKAFLPDGFYNVILDEEALKKLKKRAPKYDFLSRKIDLAVPADLQQELPTKAREPNSALNKYRLTTAVRLSDTVAVAQHAVRAWEHLKDYNAKVAELLEGAEGVDPAVVTEFVKGYERQEAHLSAVVVLQAHLARSAVQAFRTNVI